MRIDRHEFQLMVQPAAVARKAKYTRIRPSGSVVQAYTVPRKRRKWAEICADLCSPLRRPGNLPSKREDYGERMVREYGRTLWEAVCERWTPALRERWLAIDRLPETAEKEFAFGIFWDEEIEAVSGFRDAVGRDPTGTADVIDTWLFTQRERREFLLIANADMTAFEAVSQADTVDVTRRGARIICPRGYLDWETDLDLTPGDIDRIKDPAHAHHPRLDLPVGKSLFRLGSQHADLGRV